MVALRLAANDANHVFRRFASRCLVRLCIYVPTRATQVFPLPASVGTADAETSQAAGAAGIGKSVAEVCRDAVGTGRVLFLDVPSQVLLENWLCLLLRRVQYHMERVAVGGLRPGSILAASCTNAS